MDTSRNRTTLNNQRAGGQRKVRNRILAGVIAVIGLFSATAVTASACGYYYYYPVYTPVYTVPCYTTGYYGYGYYSCPAPPPPPCSTCSCGSCGGGTPKPPATITYSATLRLDRSSAEVGELIWATVTVTDSNGRQVRDANVNFRKSSAAISLSATTCMTDSSGQCQVSISSTSAGTYRDEIEARATVDGKNATMSGSPATVTFTETIVFSYDKSTFDVFPVADPNNRATWPVADGVDYYVGKLVAKDTKGRPMTGLRLGDINFTATGLAIRITDVTSEGDGSYTVHYTSTVAQWESTAKVAYQSRQVGSTLPIPFS